MQKAVLNVKDGPQLDAGKVAERIGVSLSDWPGNCYAIACKLVKSKMVKAQRELAREQAHVATETR